MITDILYHGTKEEFDLREMKKPAYFTSNPKIASWFASKGNPRLICARIKAERVYEIDWMYKSWGGGFVPSDNELFEEFVRFASDGDEEEISYWEENGFCIDMFASMMAEKGIELVICRNVLEECGITGDIYVALGDAKIMET